MIVKLCETHTKLEEEFNFRWLALKFRTHNFHMRHMKSDVLMITYGKKEGTLYLNGKQSSINVAEMGVN